MSFALTAFDDLFGPSLPDPAVAAAVAVLCTTPPAPSPPDLDAALRAVAPHLTDAERSGWVSVLAAALPKAGITAPRCVAAFLGQCAVESAGFRSLEEDLSYSVARLCQVWPTHFPTSAAAEPYTLEPERLANRVYTGRMGNGNEASGDGWRFRGRGLIQITGRSAYEHFAQAMAMTLDQAVACAGSPAGAANSAIWFWVANDLNTLAASWSLDLLTRKISGGTTGAAERNRLCEAALHVIGA